MDIETEITLSTATDIYEKASPTTNGYSFVNALGNFVVNHEYSHGFRQFSSQKHNSSSYIWEVISAAGQEFGDVMYQSVKDYINNVSNVDTCHLKALKSMLKMIDMKYDIIENVDYYPNEIIRFINIFSINRKYLLDNHYIKDDFIQSLSTDSVLFKYTEDRNGVYSKETFDSYVGGIFYNLIYDILNHSITDGKNVVYVRNTLDGLYGSTKEKECYDEIDTKVLHYNIGNDFDYVKIVDDINNGDDSISNYQGYKLEILQDVISERNNGYVLDGRYIKTSKYFYYIKKKVIDIAEFVDNTYINISSLMNNVTYDYDNNYFNITEDGTSRYVIKDELDEHGNRIIDTEMIKNVASILVQIVNYIRKLRQRAKLHTKRVYMKGTNNLLKYTVGVFLLDYIEQMKYHIENGREQVTDEEYKKFQDIYDNIQQSMCGELGINGNVKVQEYWDQTEYMNLSTETSQYAHNKGLVNERFFDNYFHEEGDDLYVDDPKNFTTEQINDFYLHKLGLNNHFRGNVSTNETQEQIQQKFYRFLQCIFDIGANTSYYDEELSVFGSKLQDGEYSTRRHVDLNEIIKIREELSGLMDYTDQYEFDPEMTLEEQENHFLEKYELKLAEEYLSAVSSLYDEQHPIVESLSSQRDTKKTELEAYLSGEFFYYFEKSDNEYCLAEDGSYNLDYFLGNDEYPVDSYLYDRMNDAYEWITSGNHCRNWPILCASTTMKAEYEDIKSLIESEVITNLTQYGYTEPTTENLGTILEDSGDFIQTKIQNRLTYLTNALENLRNQANELKTQHDNIANNVDQIIAQNPGLEQGYYFTYVGKTYGDDGWVANGSYASSSEGATDKIGEDKSPVCSEYDKFSGGFFIQSDSEKKAIYDKKTITVDLTGALESRVDALKGVFSDIYYGENAANNTGVEEALQSASTNLNSIETQIDSIVDQIEEIFQMNSTELADIKTTGQESIIIDRITTLISYLGTKITETDFENDLKMKEYRGYEDSVRQLTEKYEPIKIKYDNLYVAFGNFLIEFENNNPNYTTFSATNLQKIYDFTISQDNKNLEIIKTWFENFNSEYELIVSQFQDKVTELHDTDTYFLDENKKEYIYEFSSNIIEECIADFENALLQDVQSKILIGNAKILEKVTYCRYKIFGRIIELYFKHLDDEVGTYDEVTGRTDFEVDFIALKDQVWTDKTLELNEYLDYTKDSNYIQSRKIFKSYSGLDTVYDDIYKKTINIANDPYYNHKNLTHPSYQIHPFLWNFIECKNTDTITDSIVKYITNMDMEELESPIVQNNIDKYLYIYGNAKKIWQNNIVDYSGWTTRYEESEHICQYTNLSSEVVDYDGAFYPPAIVQYRKGNKTVDSLSAYYKHLKYDSDSESKSKTNDNLKKNYSKICEITNSHSLSDIYDIYKYQIDTFGNMYILYKRYLDENPSAEKKLKTEGELWVRLADNPIAFPISDIIDSISYKPLLEGGKNFRIIDININGAKTRMVIAFKNDKGEEYFVNLFLNYSTTKSGIGTLKITSYNLEDDSKNQIEVYPTTTQRGVSWSYLGTYNRCTDIDRTDVVFIDKLSSGLIDDNPNIFIYRCNTQLAKSECSERIVVPTGKLYTLSKTSIPPLNYWSDYNDYNYIDLIFLNEVGTDVSGTVYKDRTVDMINNTSGNQFENVTATEMNSHDRFNQNILLCRYNLDNSDGFTVRTMNINSDIGYIPAYPGILSTNIFDISEELGDNYQSIELMGRSKNIDGILSCINDNTNPYLTKEQILSGYLYGRVFEDFNIDNDKTLNIYTNEPMFKNMRNDTAKTWYSPEEKCYYWKFELSDYTYEDIKYLKIIMYKTDSVGKNPYLIRDLSSIEEEEKRQGSKPQWMDTNYMLEKQYNSSEYSFDYEGNKIKIVGTCNGIDQINNFFNNKLDNICDLKYKSYLSWAEPSLIFRFDIENINIESFIDSGHIRIAIINTHDFSSLEAYHFLDSNGFIKTGENGPYYNTDDGKSVLLSSIHLSSYHDKNEIYALATDKRLQFKYSDEDVFEQDDLNYYFPCLNIKIPYTHGEFFNAYYEKGSQASEEQTVKIYEDNTVYPIITQDKKVVQGMNGVVITNEEYVDELRVFEDYLSTYVGEDGNVYDNRDKYSECDPQFYQYAHFYSDTLGTYLDNNIDVPESAWMNITIDYENNEDDFSKWIYSKYLKCIKGEQCTEDESTSKEFYYSNLTEDQKEQLENGIEKFMNLYFSYKKSTNGIDLYVNYQNYINSPYVKLNGEELISEKIEGTYAVVKQNETKTINIVLQMCMYQGNKIYGVKNITVATFRISNISDDKPKFILTRVGNLDNSNFGTTHDQYSVIEAEKKNVTVNETYRNFKYSVRLKSNYDIAGTVSCIMTYDSYLLSSSQNTQTEKKYGNGQYKLYFTQQDRTREINFAVKDITTTRMKKLVSKPRPMAIYDIGIDDDQPISAVNGYVIIDNQSKETIKGGVVNPSTYISSGTASTWNYSKKPTVSGIQGEFDETLYEGNDYEVSYPKYSGSINIPGDVTYEDITVEDSSPIQVVVTGINRYKGTLTFNVPVVYTKTDDSIVLGWTKDDKLVTSQKDEQGEKSYLINCEN